MSTKRTEWLWGVWNSAQRNTQGKMGKDAPLFVLTDFYNFIRKEELYLSVHSVWYGLCYIAVDFFVATLNSFTDSSNN